VSTPAARDPWVIVSHVRNVSKPITSRSAACQATKTRETLATARAILRESGYGYEAHQLDQPLAELSARLQDWYREVGRAHAHSIGLCKVCHTGVERTGRGELIHANRMDVANNHQAVLQ
jgi:hypothetical protein